METSQEVIDALRDRGYDDVPTVLIESLVEALTSIGSKSPAGWRPNRYITADQVYEDCVAVYERYVVNPWSTEAGQAHKQFVKEHLVHGGLGPNEWPAEPGDPAAGDPPPDPLPGDGVGGEGDPVLRSRALILADIEARLGLVTGHLVAIAAGVVELKTAP